MSGIWRISATDLKSDERLLKICQKFFKLSQFLSCFRWKCMKVYTGHWVASEPKKIWLSLIFGHIYIWKLFLGYPIRGYFYWKPKSYVFVLILDKAVNLQTRCSCSAAPRTDHSSVCDSRTSTSRLETRLTQKSCGQNPQKVRRPQGRGLSEEQKLQNIKRKACLTLEGMSFAGGGLLHQEVHFFNSTQENDTESRCWSQAI